MTNEVGYTCRNLVASQFKFSNQSFRHFRYFSIFSIFSILCPRFVRPSTSVQSTSVITSSLQGIDQSCLFVAQSIADGTETCPKEWFPSWLIYPLVQASRLENTLESVTPHSDFNIFFIIPK
jgi:hypothetical protein